MKSHSALQALVKLAPSAMIILRLGLNPADGRVPSLYASVNQQPISFDYITVPVSAVLYIAFLGFVINIDDPKAL